MFFRKNLIEKVISKLEPLDFDRFLEVDGLSGMIASDKLRYLDGIPVSCLSYAEVQILTRKLSKSFKVRLPTLGEDYEAFRSLDEEFRKTVLSQPFEWKADYLDGSFLMKDPNVRKINLPRQYEFEGELRIVPISYESKFIESIDWFGVSRDAYGRAAAVRGYSFDKNGKRYSAGMVSPLSKECIGLRLFIEE